MSYASIIISIAIAITVMAIIQGIHDKRKKGHGSDADAETDLLFKQADKYTSYRPEDTFSIQNIHHNDIHHNDIHHNDIQHNDIHHND